MKAREILATACVCTVATTTPLAAEDVWVKDQRQGCEIWSETAAADGDVITWTGGCADGRASGKGLMMWTRDGILHARFDGTMAGGKMNGPGLLVAVPDEGTGFDVVTGTFVDGRPDGTVMYKSADNGFFVGGYRDGQMDGDVLFVEADGGSFEGTFAGGAAQGLARTIDADGEMYEGQLRDNQRHGNGRLVMADGGVYEGAFDRGAMSGFGRFEAADGSAYAGMFTDDKPDGAGVYEDADGATYQGNFKMGELDGQVLVTASDGTQSVETWANGERQ